MFAQKVSKGENDRSWKAFLVENGYWDRIARDPELAVRLYREYPDKDMLEHIRKTNPVIAEKIEKASGSKEQFDYIYQSVSMYNTSMDGFLNGMTDEEVNAGLNVIREQTEQLVTSDLTGLRQYMKIVQVFDDRLRTSYEDTEKRTNARMTLCTMVRNAVVNLHNAKGQAANAAYMAKILMIEFGDLPTVGAQLKSEWIQLELKAPATQNFQNVQNSQNNQSGTLRKGCLFTILGVLVFFVIVSVLSTISKDRRNSQKSSTKSTPTTAPTATNTPTPKPEVEYAIGMTAGEPVYLDVTSIVPEYGIYQNISRTYTYYACSCETASGGKVWVLVSAEYYRNTFDSSVPATELTLSFSNVKKVTFSPSKRIHGETVKADDYAEGLKGNTSYVVILLKSVE